METTILQTVERTPAEYADRRGYDADFLGVRIALPALPKKRQKDVVKPKAGKGKALHYTHFSVVLSAARRLAYFTAVNIDGRQSMNLERARDRWYFDPRIDRTVQSGPELYAHNDLDRGHLVRRLDPVWGSNATLANEDTFHFTNCAPQHKHLNQQTWLSLEDYILRNANLHDLKVTVFTGPVLRADDVVYRQRFQIPAEFWKVVCVIKQNGQLSATAYLQTQKNLIIDLEFAFGAYRTYQVPVARIEQITELDFGTLRHHDPLVGQESMAAGHVIQGPGDLHL
jgi:endonuclease G